MRLNEFVPIHNCIINGYSLVENVFGTDFVVTDEAGSLYTTVHNVKLLRRAQALLEDLPLGSEALALAIEELRREADILSPDCYRRSVARELRELRMFPDEYRDRHASMRE